MADVVPLRRAEQIELFPTIDIDKWIGKRPPRREWMVEGIFPRRNVVIMTGDGGLGKSLLAQHLCSCAVLGRPWLGFRVAEGRAVYFGCEDEEEELWRRQEDIVAHLGVEISDVRDGGLTLAARVGRDNTLGMINKANWSIEPTKLMGRVIERCVDIGANYLVLDTLAQVFGGNPNDPRHVVQFVGQLRNAAKAINGVVILVMHPSLSGRANKTGEMGNTQWTGTVRARAYLHKDKATGLVLDLRKNNYGPDGQMIPLEYRKGVFVVRAAAAPRLPCADD